MKGFASLEACDPTDYKKFEKVFKAFSQKHGVRFAFHCGVGWETKPANYCMVEKIRYDIYSLHSIAVFWIAFSNPVSLYCHMCPGLMSSGFALFVTVLIFCIACSYANHKQAFLKRMKEIKNKGFLATLWASTINE